MIDFADEQSLDERLAELDGMTAEELETMRGRLRPRVLGDQTPDLSAKQRAQQQDRQARQEAGMSGYQRLVSRVKQYFGHTPERDLRRRIEQARGIDSSYSAQVDRLEELLDGRIDQSTAAGQKHLDASNYFEVCRAQYRKHQERVDRLEAEVGLLDEGSDSRLSKELYDKRELLHKARREHLEIRKEVDQAMQTYVSARNSDKVRTVQVREMQASLLKFNQQRSAFQTMISGWEDEYALRSTEDGESIIQLYEKIGIIVQDNQRFLANMQGRTETLLDMDYMVGGNVYDDDPQVQEWLELRAL